MIFTIWDKGQDRLHNFLQEINSFHPSIKFSAEYSTNSVPFLDTEVILRDGTIHTDLYTKPTDTHQFLLPNSCHPKHCTTSIPYSQWLRIRRMCSQEDCYLRRTAELKTHLLARDYEELKIDLQIQRVFKISHEQALQPSRHKAPIERVPLVTTYHPAFTRLAHMTR